MTREERALTTGIINCRIFFRKVVLLGATVGLSSRGPPAVVLGVGVGGEVPSGPARAASRSARWLGVRGGRPRFLEHVAGTTGGGDSSCSSGAGGGGGDGGGGGVTEGGGGQSGDGGDVEGDGRDGRDGGGGRAGGVRDGEGNFASSFSSASIISFSATALSSFSPPSSSFSSSFTSSPSFNFCSLLQQGPSPCPGPTLP